MKPMSTPTALLATWAGRDADDPIVLKPFVPPKVERQLGLSRNPRETLHELQIGSDLLEASELDIELARPGRARRCVGHQDAGPGPMHLARLRGANVPQRQDRLAEVAGDGLRRAEQHKTSGQQNRSMREIHLRGLLSPCGGEPARPRAPSPAPSVAIDIALLRCDESAATTTRELPCRQRMFSRACPRFSHH